MRPSYVASWPEWELDLVEQFTAKEPAGEDRIEILLAKLLTILSNRYRKDGTPEMKVKDALQYRGVWLRPDITDSRYSEADRSVLETLL